MHLTGLNVENFKRVEAVNLTFAPQGGMIEVCGSNGNGKSSCLDAIWAALGGARAAPIEPIRKGKREAAITLRVGGLIVTRKWTQRGGTSLVVADADGVPRRSPQTILDALFNALGFDPLAFLNQSPAQQTETLKRLVGLDFTDLATERAALYAERTAANKVVKGLEARVEAAPLHPDAPAEEISVGDLTGQLRSALETKQHNDAFRASGEKIAKALTDGERKKTDLERRIGELEEQLATVMDGLEKAKAAQAVYQAKATELIDPDTAALTRRIEESEVVNCRVRENRDRQRLARELRQAREHVERFEDRMEVIDAEKQNRLATARFPVPSLSLDDNLVTLNGLPLAQASLAEQIAACLAIGGALNPQLKVILVREGSFLDPANLARVAQWAETHDYQVFIERVQNRVAGSGVILVDGRVAEQHWTPQEQEAIEQTARNQHAEREEYDRGPL